MFNNCGILANLMNKRNVQNFLGKKTFLATYYNKIDIETDGMEFCKYHVAIFIFIICLIFLDPRYIFDLRFNGMP